MSKKLWALSIVGACILLVAGGIYRARAARYSCTAGPNEICASDSWYRDYARLKAFQEKYRAPQEEIDQMNGLNMRLRQSEPQGFEWNEDKQRFTRLPEGKK